MNSSTPLNAVTFAVRPGLTVHVYYPSTQEVEADQKFKIHSGPHETSIKREGEGKGCCAAAFPTDQSGSSDRTSFVSSGGPLEVPLQNSSCLFQKPK